MPRTVQRIEYRGLGKIGHPKYRVGNDGSVWRLKGAIPRWVQLKGSLDKDGYIVVKLSRGTRYDKYRVHQLVLIAFYGPCPDGMEACHYPDEDRSNNRADNLR